MNGLDQILSSCSRLTTLIAHFGVYVSLGIDLIICCGNWYPIALVSNLWSTDHKWAVALTEVFWEKLEFFKETLITIHIVAYFLIENC